MIEKVCELCSNRFDVGNTKRGRKKRFCSGTCAKRFNGLNNKGKKRSDEYKIELSKKLKGENNPFYGKRHSDEFKKNMSEKRAGISFRPVLFGKEKILSKIIKQGNGCWEWVGARHGKDKDYGGLKIKGKGWLAHRYSYTVFKGDIPFSMLVCHTCDNRVCVNPDHLFLGTQDDNMKDMASKHRGTVGEKGVHSKLTANKVMEIKFALKNGLPRKDLSYIFNISLTAIKDIYNKKTWRYLL